MKKKGFNAAEKQRLANVLFFLSENGFSKSTDKCGTYSEDDDLYFRLGKNGQYVVVNHYVWERKAEDHGFDLWMAEYQKESDIGLVEPIWKEIIVRSFKVENMATLSFHILEINNPSER
ncbi:MAG: hypothetical protein IPL65_15755 [Lewinellaceae bacterium]|nr:hypothetical protein [Lewinellaceae bacterium]